MHTCNPQTRYEVSWSGGRNSAVQETFLVASPSARSRSIAANSVRTLSRSKFRKRINAARASSMRCSLNRCWGDSGVKDSVARVMPGVTRMLTRKIRVVFHCGRSESFVWSVQDVVDSFSASSKLV